MWKHPTLFLLLTVVFYSGATKAQGVVLKQGDKTRYLGHYKSVYFVSLDKDSTQREILMADSAGAFIKKDTAYIRPVQLAMYRYYKNGMLYSRVENFPDTTRQRIKLPVRTIYRIDIERPGVEIGCGVVAVGSLLSSLIVSPILAAKGGFDTDKFYRLEGISLGMLATSLIIRQSLGVKHYSLQHRKRHKNWTLMP